MAVARGAWKVHPHGHLTQVDDNILTVTGTILMPAGRLPRRMTVVRLAHGELVIFSAMSLADDICVIDNGGIQFVGTRDEFDAHPEIRDTYLSV